MSSLASLVATGPLKLGDDGSAVLALQLALSQAGYRVGQDGDFGPRTQQVVAQFQTQHGLRSDGMVGPLTAALLDAPHETLVATAKPLTNQITAQIGSHPYPAMPHDDTASLLAFYGKPWINAALLTTVPVPFPMSYGAAPVTKIQVHVKSADALKRALETIAAFEPAVRKHVQHFSGTYNYRPIRGSSRLSCHAFGAAIDFDAANLPLGHGVPASEMPQEVVDAFESQGFFWGGDYTGRKDPMHFQLAHE